MIIVGCSQGLHLAKKIANKLRTKYIKLEVKRFPDNEIYLRYPRNIKGHKIVLVQSFYGKLNAALMEVFFAAETAIDLGAKEVTLVAPYFPYLRQDKRFKPGECISIKVIGEFVDDCCDKVIIIDPHLHREKTLSHVFKIPSKKLSARPLIADYTKRNIKNPLLIGPDEESYRWARKTAEKIGAESVILEKKRFTGRKVKVFFNKKIDLKNKNAVLVDDMVSTGNTLIDTIRQLKSLKPKNIYCIAVHGIFVEKALERLKKTGVKVITSNTIPNKAQKLDVAGIIAEALK